MFTTTGLFKSIPCPRANRTDRERCDALNCIFSHDSAVLATLPKRSTSTTETQAPTHTERPATKRRKLENGSAVARDSTVGSGETSTTTNSNADRTITPKAITAGSKSSLNRPISPPPTKTSKVTSTPRKAKKPSESLVPRMITLPPAGHDKRCLYLRCIHDELKRLNEVVKASSRSDKAALKLDDQELISMSNDEEEKLARANSALYPNQIKRRIGQLKKMTIDEWVDHLKKNIFTDPEAEKGEQATNSLDTGLTEEQERRMLRSHLLTPSAKLQQMGYILKPPTEEAIENADKISTLAANWEVCDRCKTRFQVFPERRAADGALTTNGPCSYHWGKLRRPPRKKTDAITGAREPMYTCCGEFANTPGCSSADTHVYKIDQAARMSWVTAFMNTPENTNPARTGSGRRVLAVTFDCELGYTVYGMELIRLTAISWPENEEIMDILVQPRGTVLDFNSRFSGVTAETFKSAKVWTKGMSLLPTREAGEVSTSSPLPIVSSPEVARELLCSFITPETPLIGHALENDLNSVRLCHPNVADTVALFPHPAGLPIRYSLKQLALVYLNRDIQTGGEMGHDSLEDARATGDLVRVKAGRKWKELEAKGQQAPASA